MQSATISRFQGGFADNYLSSPPNTSKLLNNFLLDVSGNPYTREGIFAFGTRISSNRISGIYVDNDPFSRPFFFNSSSVNYLDGSDAIQFVLGPASNDAIPNKTSSDLESANIWRKQVIYASAPATVLPHRIYCPTFSATPSFLALTLGLPEPSTPTVTASNAGSNYNYLYAVHFAKFFIDYQGTQFEERSPVIQVLAPSNTAVTADYIRVGAGATLPTLVNTASTNYDVGTALTKTTITATNTSKILTGFVSTTDIALGAAVEGSGTGITKGSYVLSKTATTVTLNFAATNTETVTISFYSAVIEIYRSVNNGSTLYHVATVRNALPAGYYDDTLSDTTLVTQAAIYTDGGVLEYAQPPVGSYFCTQVNDFFWYATPTLITQSVQGAPGACPLDFNQPIDQKILGLNSVISFPILFCDRSVYRVEGVFDDFGNNGFELREISKIAGCVSNRSIVSIPGGLVWAGNGGFYFTDGYQVQKISHGINDTYQIWKNTSIEGSYDAKRNIVIWLVNSASNPGFIPNDSWAVLHLNFGISEYSAFTTGSSPNNIFPVSTAYSEAKDLDSRWKAKILMGDSNGYFLYFDENAYTDPKIDNQLYVSQWTKKAIVCRYESNALPTGEDGMRSYCTELQGKLENETDCAVNFLARRDDGGAWGNFSEMRADGAILWNISEWEWGDTTLHDWDSQPVLEGKRFFPETQLRSTIRQVGLTNANTFITKSDDKGLATTDIIFKTVTLNNATKYWPQDCEDYALYFQSDNYTAYYTIKSRDSDLQVTVFDPFGSLPAGATLKWQMKGIRKFERIKLLSYTIFFDKEPTNSPNRGTVGLVNA